MHDDVTKMGGIIRAAREAKGMTQAALSQKTNIATRTIMDIENDKRHPTYEVFFKIVRALELSADHIFWPEKTEYTPEQEQLIKAISSCSERDYTVFMEIAWAFVRATKSDDNSK
ncbi:MAG: helix-turn-helix domain-containing protein [Leptospirales bacterium]|nr:helix-turn-helix domain-containing protein [Leptospirales bacterium]